MESCGVVDATLKPSFIVLFRLPANLHGGGGIDGDDADGVDVESSSSRPPAVMRSLSASPTFTVKKEKNEINEEVILDRIRNLAEEKKDDENDDENEENEGGTKKANSLPSSPTHQQPQQQQRQLVPYTNIQNKQMYIPVNVAREYIGKMSGEMRSMKENHLTIVQQIEEAYRWGDISCDRNICWNNVQITKFYMSV